MKRSNIVPILGIVAGIIAIIFAIIVFAGAAPSSSSAVTSLSDMDTGTRTSYEYYGGDAYTGIQQAAADTARNVKNLAEINRKGFDETISAINSSSGKMQPDRFPYGAILLVMGLSLIVFSLHSLNEARTRSLFESNILRALSDINTHLYESGNPAATSPKDKPLQPETVIQESPVAPQDEPDAPVE